MIDWNLVSRDFEPDGSYRDILVLDASIELWNKTLHYIKNIDAKTECIFIDKVIGFPDDIESVVCDEGGITINIFIERVQINCFCNSMNEIEFDISPNEILGQHQLDIVCDFIMGLGRVTERSVLLTPEGDENLVLLRYNPADDKVKFIQHYRYK